MPLSPGPSLNTMPICYVCARPAYLVCQLCRERKFWILEERDLVTSFNQRWSGASETYCSEECRMQSWDYNHKWACPGAGYSR